MERRSSQIQAWRCWLLLAGDHITIRESKLLLLNLAFPDLHFVGWRCINLLFCKVSMTSTDPQDDLPISRAYLFDEHTDVPGFYLLYNGVVR